MKARTTESTLRLHSTFKDARDALEKRGKLGISIVVNRNDFF
jgi:hypothetical protein